MKLFGKLLIVGCLSWSITQAQAQIAISTDVIGGTPLMAQSYTNVRGSAYLFENWEKGTVTLAAGKKYENVDLMFDQVANQLIFKDSDGSSKAFSQPVAAFSIGKDADKHSFGRGPDGVFYEKLTEGALTLWKKTHKSIIDEKPYGSATVQRNILNNTSYFVGELAQLTKIKTDKKSVLSVLSKNGAAIEAFVKTEKLSTKTESDLVRIFQYYNSL